MKDVLLKMILNRRVKIREEDGSISHSFIHPDFYEPLATEIADIVKAFDEWIGYNCTHGDLVYIQLTTDWIYKNKGYAYNGLFNFWYNEIYMKK